MYRVKITRNISYLHKGNKAGGYRQSLADTIKQNNQYKSCKFNLVLFDVPNIFSSPRLHGNLYCVHTDMSFTNAFW